MRRTPASPHAWTGGLCEQQAGRAQFSAFRSGGSNGSGARHRSRVVTPRSMFEFLKPEASEFVLDDVDVERLRPAEGRLIPDVYEQVVARGSRDESRLRQLC